jgi:uncharacterized protein (TIGR02599 family)
MRPSPIQSPRAGFSLVEILAAVGVLFLLLTLLLTVTNSVSTTVRRTSATIDAFAVSRSAFDLMNQKLSLATLNTYWDYDNIADPTVYRRNSDLHFLVQQNTQNAGYGQEIYFQSPESFASTTGLNATAGLLNAGGFFVQYGSNKDFRPAGLTNVEERYRYRLMHGIQPTEELGVYGATTGSAWTADISNGGGTLKKKVAPIADNVIALILWPRLAATDDPDGTRIAADGTSYKYDSRLDALTVPQPLWANQLPPTVQVTIITISEASASRLDTRSATAPSIIEGALNGKFQSVAQYESDLAEVSRVLSENHIEFHVANTSVPLRESKWSTATPQ